MNNQEIEIQLKHIIKQKVLNSGQSEEYFEKLWSLWWGRMDTDFQSSIFEFVKSLNKKENIKVIEVERYRDGGTIVFQDKMNRLYYQWYPTKKVYNQIPFPRGSVGLNNIPPNYVKEVLVDLDIVKSF